MTTKDTIENITPIRAARREAGPVADILFDMEDDMREAEVLSEILNLCYGYRVGLSGEATSFLAGQLWDRTKRLHEEWRKAFDAAK